MDCWGAESRLSLPGEGKGLMFIQFALLALSLLQARQEKLAENQKQPPPPDLVPADKAGAQAVAANDIDTARKET